MTNSLAAWLDRAAKSEHGLRFIDRKRRQTWLGWNELEVQAQEARQRLQAAGIVPGDRVALIYPTGPDFFVSFFGTLLAGAIPVPLYPPVRLGRLEEYHRQTAAMIQAVDASLVLGNARVLRLLGRTALAAQPILGCHCLGDLEPGPHAPVPRHAEDPALIQFSSGTTVAPKPVVLSERALVAQTLALNSFWPDEQPLSPSPSDTEAAIHTGVSWLPLYHDMGLIGCVLPALERPSTLTLIPPELFVTRPAIWLQTISRFRATISPAPNFAYGLCVEKIKDEELEGVDLSSWRVALNGAEAVAPSVLARFIQRFAAYGFRREALTPVYGLSEAALAVTFSRLGQPFTAHRFSSARLTEQLQAVPDENGLELASVGSPLPGFEISLRDEHNQPVPDGAVGRLWIKGPSLMSGYYQNPRATHKALVDGWLDTGDRGFLYDGELYLTGRHKDLIIHRGRNYSPEQFEQPLDRLDGVRPGCSVALSAPRFTQAPTASSAQQQSPQAPEHEPIYLLVEHTHEVAQGRSSRPGSKKDKTFQNKLQEIAEACRQAALKGTGVHVDEVAVLPPGCLPRTSSGKLRRQEALARYQTGRLAPGRDVNPMLIVRSFVDSQRAFRELRKKQETP